MLLYTFIKLLRCLEIKQCYNQNQCKNVLKMVLPMKGWLCCWLFFFYVALFFVFCLFSICTLRGILQQTRIADEEENHWPGVVLVWKASDNQSKTDNHSFVGIIGFYEGIFQYYWNLIISFQKWFSSILLRNVFIVLTDVPAAGLC